MNLSKYKEAMDEIQIDVANIENRINQLMESKCFFSNKKIVAAFIMAAVIIMCVSYLPHIMISEPSFTMTVYAAETDGVELNNDFLDIKADTRPFVGGYTQDDQGNYIDADINSNIIIKVDGQDIEAITYTCADKIVTRDTNLRSVPAYFVENITLPVEEYNHTKWSENEMWLYGFYGEGDTEAKVTQLIGSSYTVAFEEQMNIKYGMIINATVDQNQNFHFEDFTIDVAIKMKDGAEYHKQLLVHAGEDAFTDIEMKIID